MTMDDPSPRPAIKPMQASQVVPMMLADGAIAFAVANLNPQLLRQAVVCISTDAQQWGNLSVTIQNNTDEVVSLDTSSLVKLLVSPTFLTTDQIQAITVAAESGWNGEAVANGGDCYFALSPAAPISLPSGGLTTVPLQNVLASSDALGTRKFRFEYSGFDGTPDHGRDVWVACQNPPSPLNQDWPLQFSFQSRPQYGGSEDLGNSVYVTPWSAPDQGAAIVNELVLLIVNSGNSAIPLPNGASPTISISLMGGDTANCICTDEQINVVTLEVVQQDPGYQWQSPEAAEGDLPVWALAPASGAGNPSFLGLDGLVAVQIGNLVTDLPPGSSVLYVQYAGLSASGYNDGVAILPIEKLAPRPCVTNFTASIAAWRGAGTSGTITAGSTVPYGTVTATWTIFAAQTATLTVDPPPVQPSVFPVATSGSMSIPLPPGQFLDSVTYTYTLQAYADEDNPNNSNSQSATFPFTMSAAPAVQATMICWGYHLAQGDTAYFSRVKWSTTYATGCAVNDSVSSQQPISSDLAGQIDSPNNQSFQITATGPGTSAQSSGPV
jgi:hypothetical protein